VDPTAPVLTSSDSCAKPSYDPADLDCIINTQPDLTALARLAKRRRK
jgi:hypothetical protein